MRTREKMPIKWCFCIPHTHEMPCDIIQHDRKFHQFPATVTSRYIRNDEVDGGIKGISHDLYVCDFWTNFHYAVHVLCKSIRPSNQVTHAKLETREIEKKVLANNTFKALFVRVNHLVPYAIKVSFNMQFPPIEAAKPCKKASKQNFKFLFRN